MSDDNEPVKYNIRLCHIVKWDDFNGYGFNLHAERGKPGQYIGKVDEGSPAEAAGLKEGDRIIEVNGVNISNENHKQVVNRIRSSLDETKLLVVDNEADNYFKSKNIVIRSDLENVVYIKTPSSKLANGKNEDEGSQISSKNGSCFGIENNSEKLSSKSSSSSSTTTPSSERKVSDESHTELQLDLEMNNTHSQESESNRVIENNKLNLNMTASELRAKLAQRKKYDPKKDCLDFKKKYEIIQKLSRKTWHASISCVMLQNTSSFP